MPERNTDIGTLRICLVAGARPNFMKIAPLLDRLQQQPARFSPFLVHTGQHYDEAMSAVFFNDLGLPRPDVYLGVGSGSHAVQTARIMTAFEDVVLEQRPDLVLVVGDVNSTIACGLVAAKCHIPLAHVEAGLRSGDRRMPEEINRILTDQLADLLFTTCRGAADNLRAEGIGADKIFFCGNLMIESLIRHAGAFDDSPLFKNYSLTRGAYGLVTLHRPSNVDDPEVLRGLIEAMTDISRDLPLIFPAHPRTAERLRSLGMSPGGSGFRICEPAGYLDFMALQKHAGLVITDSGGIQEETTYFGVPCLTVRENTERPVTVSEGTNILVGTDPGELLRRAKKVLAGDVKSGAVPEFWDGEVSARIARVLEQRQGETSRV